MKITKQFTEAQVQAYIEDKMQKYFTAVIRAFAYVGENFIKNSREKTAAEGGFNDRTGNLRSSIGYVILVNGEEFQASDFGKVLPTAQTGPVEGKALIDSLKPQYSEYAVALICVAGMDYAAAVEARGKDVITGSSLVLIEEIKVQMRDLKIFNLAA